MLIKHTKWKCVLNLHKVTLIATVFWDKQSSLSQKPRCGMILTCVYLQILSLQLFLGLTHVRKLLLMKSRVQFLRLWWPSQDLLMRLSHPLHIPDLPVNIFLALIQESQDHLVLALCLTSLAAVTFLTCCGTEALPQRLTATASTLVSSPVSWSWHSPDLSARS